MTVLKIIFVVLLCFPLAYLAVQLYRQLMKQLNRTDRPDPERQAARKRRARQTRRSSRSRSAHR